MIEVQVGNDIEIAEGTPVEVSGGELIRVGGTGTGGTFDGVHNDLDGRDTEDAHPISAITGLQAAIDAAGGADPRLIDVDVAISAESLDPTVALPIDWSFLPAGVRLLSFTAYPADPRIVVDCAIYELGGVGVVPTLIRDLSGIEAHGTRVLVGAWLIGSGARNAVTVEFVAVSESSVVGFSSAGHEVESTLTRRFGPFGSNVHVTKYATHDPGFPLDGSATHVGGQAIDDGQRCTILSGVDGGVWVAHLGSPWERETEAGFGELLASEVHHYDHISITGTIWGPYSLFRLRGGVGIDTIEGAEAVTKHYRATVIATTFDGDTFTVLEVDGSETALDVAAVSDPSAVLVGDTVELVTVVGGEVKQVEDFTLAEGTWTAYGAGAIGAGTVVEISHSGSVTVLSGGGDLSGLATVATTGAYSDLTGRPTLGTAAAAATTDFAAASHSHAASAISSGTLDIARIPTGTSSTTVAVGNDARFAAAMPGSILVQYGLDGSYTTGTAISHFSYSLPALVAGDFIVVEACLEWNNATGSNVAFAPNLVLDSTVMTTSTTANISTGTTRQVMVRARLQVISTSSQTCDVSYSASALTLTGLGTGVATVDVSAAGKVLSLRTTTNNASAGAKVRFATITRFRT